MKQTQTIPEMFLGVGYTRGRAGLPLEAVRVPVPRPAADEVLIRVAASSLNPLEYKLADLNFLGRTPPVVLGLDLSGVVVAAGHNRRADRCACLGGQTGHQQRQHAAIDCIGPAVRRASRFRL